MASRFSDLETDAERYHSIEVTQTEEHFDVGILFAKANAADALIVMEYLEKFAREHDMNIKICLYHDIKGTENVIEAGTKITKVCTLIFVLATMELDDCEVRKLILDESLACTRLAKDSYRDLRYCVRPLYFSKEYKEVTGLKGISPIDFYQRETDYRYFERTLKKLLENHMIYRKKREEKMVRNERLIIQNWSVRDEPHEHRAVNGVQEGDYNPPSEPLSMNGQSSEFNVSETAREQNLNVSRLQVSELSVDSGNESGAIHAGRYSEPSNVATPSEGAVGSARSATCQETGHSETKTAVNEVAVCSDIHRENNPQTNRSDLGGFNRYQQVNQRNRTSHRSRDSSGASHGFAAPERAPNLFSFPATSNDSSLKSNEPVKSKSRDNLHVLDTSHQQNQQSIPQTVDNRMADEACGSSDDQNNLYETDLVNDSSIPLGRNRSHLEASTNAGQYSNLSQLSEYDHPEKDNPVPAAHSTSDTNCSAGCSDDLRHTASRVAHLASSASDKDNTAGGGGALPNSVSSSERQGKDNPLEITHTTSESEPAVGELPNGVSSSEIQGKDNPLQTVPTTSTEPALNVTTAASDGNALVSSQDSGSLQPRHENLQAVSEMDYRIVHHRANSREDESLSETSLINDASIALGGEGSSLQTPAVGGQSIHVSSLYDKPVPPTETFSDNAASSNVYLGQSASPETVLENASSYKEDASDSIRESSNGSSTRSTDRTENDSPLETASRRETNQQGISASDNRMGSKSLDSSDDENPKTLCETSLVNDSSMALRENGSCLKASAFGEQSSIVSPISRSGQAGPLPAIQTASDIDDTAAIHDTPSGTDDVASGSVVDTSCGSSPSENDQKVEDSSSQSIQTPSGTDDAASGNVVDTSCGSSPIEHKCTIADSSSQAIKTSSDIDDAVSVSTSDGLLTSGDDTIPKRRASTNSEGNDAESAEKLSTSLPSMPRQNGKDKPSKISAAPKVNCVESAEKSFQNFPPSTYRKTGKNSPSQMSSASEVETVESAEGVSKSLPPMHEWTGKINPSKTYTGPEDNPIESEESSKSLPPSPLGWKGKDPTSEMSSGADVNAAESVEKSSISPVPLTSRGDNTSLMLNLDRVNFYKEKEEKSHKKIDKFSNTIEDIRRNLNREPLTRSGCSGNDNGKDKADAAGTDPEVNNRSGFADAETNDFGISDDAETHTECGAEGNNFNDASMKVFTSEDLTMRNISGQRHFPPPSRSGAETEEKIVSAEDVEECSETNTGLAGKSLAGETSFFTFRIEERRSRVTREALQGSDGDTRNENFRSEQQMETTLSSNPSHIFTENMSLESEEDNTEQTFSNLDNIPYADDTTDDEEVNKRMALVPAVTKPQRETCKLGAGLNNQCVEGAEKTRPQTDPVHQESNIRSQSSSSNVYNVNTRILIIGNDGRIDYSKGLGQQRVLPRGRASAGEIESLAEEDGPGDVPRVHKRKKTISENVPPGDKSLESHVDDHSEKNDHVKPRCCCWPWKISRKRSPKNSIGKEPKQRQKNKSTESLKKGVEESTAAATSALVTSVEDSAYFTGEC